MDDPRDLNLEDLRQRAVSAAKDEAPAAWDAYHARHRAEVARRDKLRHLHAMAARSLGDRVGRLPGIVVEEAEADDFGRAELRLTIDGVRRWTRTVPLDDGRGYARIRDAISAYRRKDWRRASYWLSHEAPPRSHVQWGAVEQVRFGRNGYGYERWRY